MKIAFDLDGVLYDFVWCSRAACITQYGLELPAVPKAELVYDFWDQWGLTADEFWGAVKASKYTFNRHSIDERWVNLIEALRSHGHSIHVVTARTLFPENTVGWIKEQLPDMVDTITLGAKDKTIVDWDVLIEDSPGNIVAGAEAGRNVIIWDQPWNQDDHLDHLAPEFHHLVHRANRISRITQQIVRLAASQGTREMLQDKDGETVLQDKDGETVLEEAQRLIYGDRNADYGHPLDDFSKTAGMLTALFGHEFVAEDVPLIMNIVKMSREKNRPKRDNAVDGAGYWGTLQMVKDERARRDT